MAAGTLSSAFKAHQLLDIWEGDNGQEELGELHPSKLQFRRLANGIVLAILVRSI